MTTRTFTFEFKLLTHNVTVGTNVPVIGVIPAPFSVFIEAVPSFDNIYEIAISSDEPVTSSTGTYTYKGKCKCYSKTLPFVVVPDPFDIEVKSMTFPKAKCGATVRVTVSVVMGA